TKGAIIATAIGYSVSIIINMFVIRYYADYSYRLVFRRGLLIVIFSLMMGAVVGIMYKVLALFLTQEGRIQAMILVVICALGGAFFYFVLAWRTRLLQVLFPEQAKKIGKNWHLLKIKKLP